MVDKAHPGASPVDGVEESESAFAVPTEVTWATDTFGDEDLAGASPPAVDPTQKEAVPDRPQPAALGDVEVPEWAAIRPTRPLPGTTKRPTPEPATPVTPATPATAPAPAPVVAPAPHPGSGLPSRRPGPSTPAPPVSPVASERRHPAVPPGPAAASGSEVEAEDVFDVASPGQPAPTVPGVAPGERRVTGRSRGAKPSRSGHPKTATRRAEYAGGRWKIKLLRGSVYTVLGLLLIGGAKNVVIGNRAPATDQIVAQVRTQLGDTGFPVAAAEGFAARFATVYLTYDPDSPQDRAALLGLYADKDASRAWGWTGTGGKQSVVDGPYVAGRTVSTDASSGVVTVTAKVSSGRWVYLSVPVHAVNSDVMAVAGPPVFVPPPVLADTPRPAVVTDRDSALEETLTDSVLPGFFRAWAASNEVELDRYVSEDATVTARNGLAGAVTLTSVTAVTVPSIVEGADPARDGVAEVVWAVKGAGEYVQAYRFTVVQDSTNRWSVRDIGVIPAPDEASPTPGAAADPEPGR